MWHVPSEPQFSVGAQAAGEVHAVGVVVPTHWLFWQSYPLGQSDGLPHDHGEQVEGSYVLPVQS